MVGLAGTLITLKVVKDIADDVTSKKKKGGTMFDMGSPMKSRKSKGGLYDI